MSTIDPNRQYSLKDYLTWDERTRYELIEGVPFLLASPSPQHQEVASNLHGLIWGFLDSIHSVCRVYSAPTDLALFADETTVMDHINTIVQPDLFVICQDRQGNLLRGVPAWIIEILSPSTAKEDLFVKFALYQKAKVQEYWVVDPVNQYVRVFLLQGDQYQEISFFDRNERVTVTTFPALDIDLSRVFIN